MTRCRSYAWSLHTKADRQSVFFCGLPTLQRLKIIPLRSNVHIGGLSGGSSSDLVLGIESSCDDTGAAVVNSSGRILGEALATQAEIHAPWGGVVPKLAQEAHERAIDGVVQRALEDAGVSPSDLSAVAVTIGPGLSLCLKVGVLKARQVAHEAQLPIIPVHHMEAHALVARCCAGPSGAAFPFLCLLVSGGHNLLVVVRGIGDYLQLGSTLDDSIGEAYDKVARLLGLELQPSGGAALELFAREGDPRKFRFPVPLRKRQNCDFSYAGLKTSVRIAIEKEVGEPSAENRQARADIAASFQQTAIRHLAERAQRGAAWAIESYPQIRTFVVAGGVASNSEVRAALQAVAAEAGLELVCPPPRLCTDNGVMVAWAGIERLALGHCNPPPESPVPSDDEWIDLRPRWPLTDEKDSRCAPVLKSSRKKNINRPLFSAEQ
eukprot:CAMPEP_0177594820 /NCGR_PEP_ID=MMETSP0419_2-20121207/9994_1 /TAXON_ID=582737 /ORGANISM="Tetraselmis sp., Strain GSL018" /LENGTH=435 /DNA_ID=CAMNT_0019086173 /DNA_START=88 /DNA_END=1395 /DNA_ORIENTATION=-